MAQSYALLLIANSLIGLLFSIQVFYILLKYFFKFRLKNEPINYDHEQTYVDDSREIVCKVIHCYQSEKHDELTIQPGERIVDVYRAPQSEGAGWWKGKLLSNNKEMCLDLYF